MNSWEDFIDEGKIVKTNIDTARIKSLIQMSDSILQSLERIKIDDINSSMILSNYYESLRLVVEALSIQNGLLIYSHEALPLFIKRELKSEGLGEKFDYYRKLRNGINYYGRHVESNITTSSAKEIKDIIKELKAYIRGN
jgi:hypothetical protein